MELLRKVRSLRSDRETLPTSLQNSFKGTVIFIYNFLIRAISSRYAQPFRLQHPPRGILKVKTANAPKRNLWLA